MQVFTITVLPAQSTQVPVLAKNMNLYCEGDCYLQNSSRLMPHVAPPRKRGVTPQRRRCPSRKMLRPQTGLILGGLEQLSTGSPRRLA